MSGDMLPELRDNPFTAVLGPPPSLTERFGLLDRPAPFDEAERNLPHDQRKYAVLRLLEVSVPVQRQIDLVERINMAVRQGYKARDPARGWHRTQFLASSGALSTILNSKRDLSQGRSFNRAWEGDDPVGMAVAASRTDLPVLKSAGAAGFALIGVPGMGKSTTTGVTLGAIPQVVEHNDGYYLKQLVWMKIECPPAPTRRQVCQVMFEAIDTALGTDYTVMFFDAKGSAEAMVARLQNLMVLHAVGLIVIDEIQNVAHAAERHETFLNFFVNLVNRLGVPLMLIGTAEARPLLGQAFRLARRSGGLGQPNWDRLQKGEEWDDWLEEMWRYQWTAEPTPLTAEIGDAIYEESQGIIDIAVKLLMLAQFRAISRGETGQPETLDAGLFHTIAEEELALARPLLQALRDGRMDVLSDIPDLVPFQTHVEQVLSKAMQMTAQDFRELREASRQTNEAAKERRGGPIQELTASIVRRGYSPAVAQLAIADALEAHAPDDTLGLSISVAAYLENVEPLPETNGGKMNGRKAKQVAKAEPSERAQITEAGTDDGDVLKTLRGSGMLVTSIDDILPGE